eukprot:3758877-Prymnesium_polylepis.2
MPHWENATHSVCDGALNTLLHYARCTACIRSAGAMRASQSTACSARATAAYLLRIKRAHEA